MSLSAPLKLVSSGQSAPASAQKSLANVFGRCSAQGRGRGAGAARRVSVQPVIRQRDDFMIWWSALMLRRCGSAHSVARQFDVTDQTGQNWINAVACPSGWMVYRAQVLWPEEFSGARHV